MDEIYQLVKIRINKVHELNKILSSPDENLKVDEIRKAKEDEKFRTEKENWILNVLKALKDYTFEQKQILCEKSIDIMKLIWPEFQLKNKLQYDDEFNKKFLEIYLKIFTEFFQPFEQTYEFRLTLRQVARPNNISMVPDMLKYLVEFSRDYFKKFMIFLAIQRQKQVPNYNQGVNQNGNIQINANSNINNLNINNQAINGNKQVINSKSSASKAITPDKQNNINKQQNTKQLVAQYKEQSIIQCQNLDKAQNIEKAENKLLNPIRKSISLHQKEENINFIGNEIKQIGQDLQHKQQRQQLMNKIQLKQSEQKYSSPLRQIYAKKTNPCEDSIFDERPSIISTPYQLQNVSSPQSQRQNNQVNTFQYSNIANQSYYPQIKKQDFSVFPSTICISWFISKEKEIKITKQTNLNSIIVDLDNQNISLIDSKIKKAKGGIEELKLMYIQIYEQLKQKNGFINSTIQQYFDKYKLKYPQKIIELNEQRDKEDREQFTKMKQQNQSFSSYFYYYNEDILGSTKKNEPANFNQISTQKIFAAKSAVQRNRKYNSQAITPPPGSSLGSVLNYSANSQITNQLIQLNQSPNNTIYNTKNNFSQNQQKINTLQGTQYNSTNQNQSNQQQQRAVSPQKYQKFDHSNIQNKLKIIRLPNIRCNSAILKPRINQTQNINPTSQNNENTQEICDNQIESITSSSKEIKLQMKISQQKMEQSIAVRQKSLSVIEIKKKMIYKQNQKQQTELLKSEGITTTNENEDNYQYCQKQENFLMDDSFALPLLNLKQNYEQYSERRLSEAKNIQDDNDLDLQNLNALSNQESETYQNIGINNELVKQKPHSQNTRNYKQDNQPNTPTSDSQGYYVLSNKKRKTQKKPNNQQVEDSDRLKNQSPQPPSHIRELIESQQFHKEVLSKTQRTYNNFQNSFISTNPNNLFSKDIDQLKQNKLFQDQNIIKQAITQKGEEHKVNNKKNSVDGSEISSSASSSISQNLVSSLSSLLPNQNTQKNINYRQQQITNLPQNGSVSNCESQVETQQQLNKLPKINQSYNRKGTSFGSVDNRKLQTLEEELKNIKKNQSTQPHMKKVQDYSNILNSYSNKNLQKEYITQNNNLYGSNYDFNNNNINNNGRLNANNNLSCNSNLQSKLISAQNNYSNNRISIINHPITVLQQDDYMKSIPSNNMMTDKFKNLLLQKISKIKGEKQKSQQEQQFQFENNQIPNCGNQMEIEGNAEGFLKVQQQIQPNAYQTNIKQKLQQTQSLFRNSQQQQQIQQEQTYSQSLTRIIQKHSVGSNNQNMVSQQPLRQNHFQDQNQIYQQDEDNIKQKLQTKNQITESDAIQNIMQIKKNKNNSFSVDKKEGFPLWNNSTALKIAYQKDSQLNQYPSSQQSQQQFIQQPKNNYSDIHCQNQNVQQQNSKIILNDIRQKNNSVSATSTAFTASSSIVINSSLLQNGQNTNNKNSTIQKQNTILNPIEQNKIVQKNNDETLNKSQKVQGNNINSNKGKYYLENTQ